MQAGGRPWLLHHCPAEPCCLSTCLSACLSICLPRLPHLLLSCQHLHFLSKHTQSCVCFSAWLPGFVMHISLSCWGRKKKLCIHACIHVFIHCEDASKVANCQQSIPAWKQCCFIFFISLDCWIISNAKKKGSHMKATKKSPAFQKKKPNGKHYNLEKREKHKRFYFSLTPPTKKFDIKHIKAQK